MSNVPDLLSQQMNADHRAEMLRQAEQDRLAQVASAAKPQSQVLYGPLLDRLGDQLIAMGRHLKERSGSAIPNTTLSMPIPAVGLSQRDRGARAK